MMFLLRKVWNMNSETSNFRPFLLLLGTAALAWTARVVLLMSHYENDLGRLGESHTDDFPFLSSSPQLKGQLLHNDLRHWQHSLPYTSHKISHFHTSLLHADQMSPFSSSFFPPFHWRIPSEAVEAHYEPKSWGDQNNPTFNLTKVLKENYSYCNASWENQWLQPLKIPPLWEDQMLQGVWM